MGNYFYFGNQESWTEQNIEKRKFFGVFFARKVVKFQPNDFRSAWNLGKSWVRLTLIYKHQILQEMIYILDQKLYNSKSQNFTKNVKPSITNVTGTYSASQFTACSFTSSWSVHHGASEKYREQDSWGGYRLNILCPLPKLIPNS